MKHRIILIVACCLVAVMAMAKTVPFGKGRLTVNYVAKNAVRVQYSEAEVKNELPDWLYVKHDVLSRADIKVDIDKKWQRLTVKDAKGRIVFTATSHELADGRATLAFASPKDECLFGLGQFQDGFTNLRGLSRRLTQVNTQISIPMLLSSKGYGVLWNNYGLTEFNPADRSVRLEKRAGAGKQETVNVTSTEGGKQEVRQRNIFEADIDIETEGDYALLLDVGQKMARRHNLCIDDRPVIEMQNLWLPPTASQIVRLKAGRHHLTAELPAGEGRDGVPFARGPGRRLYCVRGNPRRGDCLLP